MDHTVHLRYTKIAPRKMRAVADLLRGLSVNDAEAQLIVERRRPAGALLKLLRSAVAGARNDRRLESAKLYVKEIRVDKGPMLKRVLPRARGVATPIQKKMSHVTLVLGEQVRERPPRFVIVVPKKKKAPPRGGEKSRKEKASREEHAPAAKTQEKGFLKRMFRRKSA